MESVAPVLASPVSTERIDRDSTVVLGPNVGGGVGRFMNYTSNGNALIDVKGVAKEFAKEDFAVPERNLENGNDWFHMSVTDDTPGTSNDKPEFRPGDMVKIADVYGSIIGPGLGVFIGYGTTGEDCILLFDGKQIVVPIENVASVLEQDAKDNFDQMDNDGNLSPMSFGSENVKIEQPQTGMSKQEPGMDHRDEFTKWMEAVEEALTSEGAELAENVPPTGACGCGQWDCTVCFPSQDEMPGMHGAADGMGGPDLTAIVPIPGDAEMSMGDGMNQANPALQDACPMCGHSHQQDDFGQQEGCGSDFDEPAAVEFDEDDYSDIEEVEDTPDMAPNERSSDGRGIKLGTIVQKTEYRKSGEDSPMTYGGDNLDEEVPQYDDDGMAASEYYKQMQDEPKTEADVYAAQDMMSAIKYMQDLGLSKSSTVYSEDEMAVMGLDQLRKVHSEVTGEVAETGMEPPIQQGNMTMENVDNDIQTWLGRFKAYDDLRASKAPVMEKKDKVDEEGNPWEKLAKKSDDKEEKTTKTSKGGTVTKTDKGLTHKGTYGEPKKSDVKEGADQEVLDWMGRFAKLGNMKGYGR